MGISISGFCINKDCRSNVDELILGIFQAKGVRFKKKEENDSSNILIIARNKGTLDVFGWPFGSIMYLSVYDMEQLTRLYEPKCFENYLTCFFTIDSVSNSFFLNFYNKGYLRRSLMIQGDQTINNSGKLKLDEQVKKPEQLIQSLVKAIAKIDPINIQAGLQFERYNIE